MTLIDLIHSMKECPSKHIIITGTSCGLEVLISDNGNIILHEEFASSTSIESALTISPIIQEFVYG